MDAGLEESVCFEERRNCSRKIFFVLDYTFARHAAAAPIEERERYRRTVATVVVGRVDRRERGRVNICGSRPQETRVAWFPARRAAGRGEDERCPEAPQRQAWKQEKGARGSREERSSMSTPVTRRADQLRRDRRQLKK